MICVLATGFAAFPGIQNNPSAALMAALEKKRDHFERLGIRLETHVLPVVYEGLAARLSALCAQTRPDAILHFGVAARRTRISIETHARNRVDSRAADAQGARPTSNVLSRDSDEAICVRIPATEIAAKIRRAGIAARISHDAGAYLCNATLYETLQRQKELPAGFIHIPVPARADDASRPSFADIVAASEIAIVAVAAQIRDDFAVAVAEAR
jgi:pyroglutamyl-peptidase